MSNDNVTQISETLEASNPAANGETNPAVTAETKPAATGWDAAIAMAGTTQIVNVEVTNLAKNRDQKVVGAHVKLNGLKGFLPGSELPRGVRPDNVIGQTLDVLVLEADPKARGGRLIVSRKAAESVEQRAVLSTLEIGAIVDGTVEKVLDKTGVLVKIESIGFTGLVPFAEVSNRRGAKPSTIVSTGDKVKVKVLDVDTDGVRVRLSLKQAQVEDFLASLQLEQVFADRKVVGVVEFGYFVELGDKDGLLHLAEIPGKRDEKPTYQKGDTVTVRVIKIDPAKGDIGLTMLDPAERKRRAEWRERRDQEQGGTGGGSYGGGRGGNGGGNGGAFGSSRRNTERFTLPKAVRNSTPAAPRKPAKPQTVKRGDKVETVFTGHDAFKQLAAHLAPRFVEQDEAAEKENLVAQVRELKVPGFGLASTWSLDVLRSKVADATAEQATEETPATEPEATPESEASEQATDSDKGSNDVDQTA